MSGWFWFLQSRAMLFRLHFATLFWPFISIQFPVCDGVLLSILDGPVDPSWAYTWLNRIAMHTCSPEGRYNTVVCFYLFWHHWSCQLAIPVSCLFRSRRRWTANKYQKLIDWWNFFFKFPYIYIHIFVRYLVYVCIYRFALLARAEVFWLLARFEKNTSSVFRGALMVLLTSPGRKTSLDIFYLILGRGNETTQLGAFLIILVWCLYIDNAVMVYYVTVFIVSDDDDDEDDTRVSFGPTLNFCNVYFFDTPMPIN